jgi:hypothetical protein
LLKEGNLEGNTYLYAEKKEPIDIDEFYSNDGFWDDKYKTLRQEAEISFN